MNHGSCVVRKLQLVDEVNEHPMEIGLSLALSIYGGGVLLSIVGADPHAMSPFLIVIEFLFCILSILGGFSVIFGKVVRYKYLWAYGVERFGLFVSSSAWATYILGAAILTPPSLGLYVNLSVILLLAIACLVRARAIGKKADVILHALRYANEHKDEGAGG